MKRAADLRRRVLIHCDWLPSDAEAPTWQRWLVVARRRWRDVPELHEMDHLSFREELHAIEAVIAGQGVGICSDVLVAPELSSGTLVKVFDVKLAGYGFYLVHLPDHPRQKTIAAFSAWLQSISEMNAQVRIVAEGQEWAKPPRATSRAPGTNASQANAGASGNVGSAGNSA